MTNTQMLLDLMKKKKITQEELAEKIGITRQSLHSKIHNVREFKQGEIGKICEELNIRDSETREAIFFAV